MVPIDKLAFFCVTTSLHLIRTWAEGLSTQCVVVRICETCSNETRSGIGLGEGIEAVKVIPMSLEAGIPFTHQHMDTIGKDRPGPLLEPRHHRRNDVFVLPKSTPL
jgi:hypothetical protein